MLLFGEALDERKATVTTDALLIVGLDISKHTFTASLHETAS